MTKTATDVRRAALPALGAAASLSAMLFASRLPVTPDFILPRRAGWPLFALGFEVLSRPGPRLIYSVFATVLLAGAAGRAVYLAGASALGRKWSARDFLMRGFETALALALARWSFALWFDVSQTVWFPFCSLNILEPFLNFLVFFLILFCAVSTTLVRLSPRPPSILRALVPWTALNAFAAVLAASLYGAWSPPRAPALAGTSAPGGVRRLFVIMTEEEGRPGQAAYDLPVPPEDGSLEQAESGLAKEDVSRLDVLRALYEARSKLMDAAGLRRALLLGVKYGDELARSLLLEHLRASPPSPGALAALGALADETAHRVGPLGASRIALAYAHLGDAAQAAVWAKRGALGPRGIPEGLLDLSGGGALKPGRLSGRLEGVKPMRIALYRKRDPGAPYLLDAAGLVASMQPDAKGRFSFGGLPSGRYYLAFAFPLTETPRGEIRVSGHRGDLSLDARKTSLNLPPLTIKLTSR